MFNKYFAHRIKKHLEIKQSVASAEYKSENGDKCSPLLSRTSHFAHGAQSKVHVTMRKQAVRERTTLSVPEGELESKKKI